MPTIDFSPGFTAGLPTRVMRPFESTRTAAWHTTGLFMNGVQDYGSTKTIFTLMKGTVPTDFSTLTSFTSRSADVLVTWDIQNGHFAPSQMSGNPVIIASIYNNATQSGTATWFWWTCRPSYSGDNTNNIVHQVFGTVGVKDSGADLEMETTDIVSGTPYRMLNLRIQFPSSWTY